MYTSPFQCSVTCDKCSFELLPLFQLSSAAAAAAAILSISSWNCTVNCFFLALPRERGDKPETSSLECMSAE